MFYSHARLTVDKGFDNFLGSFLQLSDGFLLHLADQNAWTVRGGVVICRKANMAVDNFAPPSSRISLKGSHQKVAKRKAQSCPT